MRPFAAQISVLSRMARNAAQIIDSIEEHDGNQQSQFWADIDPYFGKNLSISQCHGHDKLAHVRISPDGACGSWVLYLRVLSLAVH